MSTKSLLWLWLLQEIVVENTKQECETVFSMTGIKVSTVPYLNESCMFLSGMSSGPHGQTFAPAHEFGSVDVSNQVCYKFCSPHKSVYSALQCEHRVCFGSRSGIPANPVPCNVKCPGNYFQFCGDDSWYTFNLIYLCMASVEAICSGMPEPVGNNMPMSTTVCLDYFNEIVPFISMFSSRQYLASHELVCDFPLRKCVVRQRYFEIKCASVSHVAHAKVQSLCEERTENSWCGIKCFEVYTIASNTLRCKAVDFKTALGTWPGNVSCTSKSCGVPPSLANTLHTSAERHNLDTITYNCKSGYSSNGLRYGKKEFLFGCKSDGTSDVPHLTCQPINCILEDGPTAKMIEFSGGSLDPNEWLKYQFGGGHTLSGTPDPFDPFTVRCLDGGHTMTDGDHAMTHCKSVQCGDPPVTAYATPLGDDFVTIAYGKQVDVWVEARRLPREGAR